MNKFNAYENIFCCQQHNIHLIQCCINIKINFISPEQRTISNNSEMYKEVDIHKPLRPLLVTEPDSMHALLTTVTDDSNELCAIRMLILA